MPRRDRRQQIMQAAEKLFTGRRFHEITLDDVIHEAGVGKGTVYRYFRDKDDLFFQTAVGGFDELCELLRTQAREGGPFAARLAAACEQIRSFFQKRRPLFRMMLSEESRVHGSRGELRRQWWSHREKLSATVAGILAEGAAAGAIRTDVNPRDLAGILLGMLRTYARDPARSPDESHGLQLVVDVFLRGAGSAGRPDRTRRATAKAAAACEPASAAIRTRASSAQSPSAPRGRGGAPS